MTQQELRQSENCSQKLGLGQSQTWGICELMSCVTAVPACRMYLKCSYANLNLIFQLELLLIHTAKVKGISFLVMHHDTYAFFPYTI